jgi:hypothetical protein
MQQASFGASPVSWSLYRGQRGGTRGRGSKYRRTQRSDSPWSPALLTRTEQRTDPVETNHDGVVSRASVDSIADGSVEMLWHNERRNWWLCARTRRNALTASFKVSLVFASSTEPLTPASNALQETIERP